MRSVFACARIFSPFPCSRLRGLSVRHNWIAFYCTNADGSVLFCNHIFFFRSAIFQRLGGGPSFRYLIQSSSLQRHLRHVLKIPQPHCQVIHLWAGHKCRITTFLCLQQRTLNGSNAKWAANHSQAGCNIRLCGGTIGKQNRINQ